MPPHTPDENDRLRAGTLPLDPEEDAVPMIDPEAPQWSRWFQPVAEHKWIDTAPPPRRPLLTLTPVEPERWRDDPAYDPPLYLPQGKTGVLASAGGTGKTQALVQLALSVATGRPWLDTYFVPETGPVLLALGEEDPNEFHRKLYYAMKALELNSEEKSLASQNIYGLPLCGQPVPMIEMGKAGAFPRQLSEYLLGVEHPWKLLIFDPASRFMGMDAEVDNAAATRFVEVLEWLANTTPGRPTVMLAHHTNKNSRRIGGNDATGVRGSSALVDGARWVSTLTRIEDEQPEQPEQPEQLEEMPEQSPPDSVCLHLAKTNYGPPVSDLLLQRKAQGFLQATRHKQTQNETSRKRKYW